MVRINHFWAGESGTTVIEYSLIIGLVALVIFAVVGTFGQSVLGLFTFGRIADTLAGAS